MNKFIAFCFIPVLLSSCAKPSTKIVFEKVDDGKIITISGQQLYMEAILKSKSMAVLFGVENCINCKDGYDQLDGYAKLMNCNTYYVDITNIDETNYKKIVDATSYANDAYKFPEYGEELLLPEMYLFSHQGVILKTQNNFVDYLNRYCEVK